MHGRDRCGAFPVRDLARKPSNRRGGTLVPPARAGLKTRPYVQSIQPPPRTSSPS
jgi:hypothetical protein